MSFHGAPVAAATVVAVDVGKNRAALSVTDADRRRVFGPVDFRMTAPAVAAVLEWVCAVLPAAAVKVGIEAAGHYHRPLLGSAVWPAGWQVAIRKLEIVLTASNSETPMRLDLTSSGGFQSRPIGQSAIPDRTPDRPRGLSSVLPVGGTGALVARQLWTDLKTG
jgi:hypothetical protein